jgi:hypothetical protein
VGAVLERMIARDFEAPDRQDLATHMHGWADDAGAA